MTELTLSEGMYLGKGKHKRVYLLSTDQTKCVKVVFNKNSLDLKREFAFRKILEKKNLHSTIIPEYYGELKTNLGNGYVFELITDYDNAISYNLKQFCYRTEPALVKSVLKEFKKVYFREKIILSDIDPTNLLVQQYEKDKYRIRIIDNIGSPVIIPLEYYFESIQNKKVTKYWYKLLKWIVAESESFTEMVKNENGDWI
jgi:hypothetical protein